MNKLKMRIFEEMCIEWMNTIEASQYYKKQGNVEYAKVLQEKADELYEKAYNFDMST